MNIEILNWLGPSLEGDKGGLKRIRGDKPIRVVIHICMKYHKETPCVAIFISS
jgi:hypothetical protein